ncbi:Nitrogen assimilation transcription factor nit-4 [Wickerhamomyces ciferrii]|uniref:Nitrogen assimilation transcription factor nit-4 n=1 Tax=Wickerhamomyces ciferrii (strain ATCC 14091 / BCRC 22168 / CBS 111 / JCM 3599 / NBRC 0793 / NRRL Y-1031 F-60-10) TaxID=1206466 RepID=K0KCL6_WICCF|nr:Nitrogen assimilation transcription factor nit-4 [Wickerhamomyces ciferrii]CCH42810.1 Nitrogen assimilation transcription factor nit-4 [Wickerhamomyces ciferrii]
MAPESRSIACTFCRKRKRKCDGDSPCGICRKYNKNGDCEYPTDKDRRKWKYDSTYVDYLELKCDLMQQFANELIRSDPEKAQLINTDFLEKLNSIPRKPNTNSSNNNSSAELLLRDLADENAIDELVSTTWKVRQDENGYTEFYGPISGRQQVIENEDYEFKNLRPNTNLDFVQISLEFKTKLIEIFKKSFAQFFYTSWLNLDEVIEWEYPSNDVSKQFLQCAIFTYSSLFTSHKDLSFIFLQEAEMLCLKATRNINDYVLQGLLILSCFELGMSLDSNSWVLNAMSSSFTQFLRLHLKDPSATTPEESQALVSLSPVKCALFWSVILQDRIITSVLGRGVRIQYFRIKTPFYTPKTMDKSSPSYIAELSFTYHTQLWYIHDRSIGQIYSFKAEFLHNSHKSVLMNQGIDSLESLKKSFPKVLEMNEDTMDSRILILHLSYSISYLLLHRAYLNQIPLKVITITLEHCEIASSIIKRLTLLESNEYNYPYFLSYLILTCATFDLFLLSNKDLSLKSKSLSRISIYIDSLLKFGKIWRRGFKDIQVLYELSKRWNLNIPQLNDALIIVENSYNNHIDQSFDYGYVNEDSTIHADNFYNQFKADM